MGGGGIKSLVCAPLAHEITQCFKCTIYYLLISFFNLFFCFFSLEGKQEGLKSSMNNNKAKNLANTKHKD